MPVSPSSPLTPATPEKETDPREDPAQSAVIELPPDASGIVVGAAGSGKTETLVARARRLVADGLPADAVLTLTPSRQTATALRDRIALTLAVATSGPPVRSVASFAYHLVRAANLAEGRESPQLLTGADEDQLLEDLLDGDAEDEGSHVSRWPSSLPAAVRSSPGFRAELRAFFAECTTLGLEPDRLEELGHDLGLVEWTAAASFFREYLDVRAGMRGAHRDAAGLVREALGVVRTAAAGWAPLDDIRVLLVDDAQELTLGAIELLEACRRRGIAVVAFGDPDLGSGAFRGARPENFARAVSLWGLRGVLDGSHRGSAWQGAVARRVTQRIGAAGVVAHRRAPSDAPDDGSVRCLVARSPAEEHDAIARILRERHVREGVDWESCAVIAHDARQVVALERELTAREVPARSDAAARPLGTVPAARDLLRLVEAAMGDFDDIDDVIAVLTGLYGRLDAIELRRLRTTLRTAELASGGTRLGNELLISGMRHPVEFVLVDTREARRAASVATTVQAVRAGLEAGDDAHQLLWTAWERSGSERVWVDMAAGQGPVAEQAHRDLDAVVALFQAAKRAVDRERAVDPRVFVRTLLDSAVADDRLEAAPAAGRVAVLTPAGSLGREFDTVIVAGVQEGVWPNTRTRGGLLHTWRLADAAEGVREAPAPVDRRRTALHDELRLLVRSLTRARRLTVVTAVDDDDTGPSAFFELLPPLQPYRGEHPLSLRGQVARHRRLLTGGPADAEADAAAQLAVLARAGVPGAAPREWYGVLPVSKAGSLFEEDPRPVRVSPSRLHALEECELNWLIAELGGDAGGATAGLGTILHSALEHAVGSDEDALWAHVESRWKELQFESAWRERAERTRARELVHRLHLYLRRFDDAGGRLLGSEPHFEVPVATTGDEMDAVVSGYIDRVELTSDDRVVIVDLKTGKSEPQTDAKVQDNPQLAAYQLAFHTGAIPEAKGFAPGGAKLLVLRPTSKTKPYAEPRQPPLSEDAREEFLSRVRSAVAVMRGETFSAPYEQHCRDEFSHGLCRIHTVGAVSRA
ncbi:ATP-dependent DNA helicase [Microbacterium aurantiacum]|uniref:ATP-dependent DNA helicase n=1 Tax=Microbacterium aurantiacum TaxID=162393 RepID=UPI001F1EE415|nr:ATP-dependent DNA helicase [Microbacterium aurantiacum]